jgi:hypothetical protein
MTVNCASVLPDPANPVELAVSTVPKNWSGNSGGDFSRPRDLRRDDSVPRSDRATQEDQVHSSAVGRSPDPHAILTFDTGTDRWHWYAEVVNRQERSVEMAVLGNGGDSPSYAKRNQPIA